MARPTFLIIGAMKGGTTSLHGYLDEHPQVQMSAVKETNFFAGEPDGNRYSPGAERIKDLGAYERLFDPAVPVRGEASPSYTMHPRRRQVPERIKETLPEAKFVYVVRDPVERLLSHYHHSLSVDGRDEPLREVLGDLDDPASPFTCPGFYAAQLERYLDHFPAERFLVIDQADLRDDRAATLGRVFTFLGVDSGFRSPRFEQELNTGRELRTHSPAVTAMRHLRSGVGPLWRRLPAPTRRRVRASVHRLSGKPLEAPTLDPGLRAELEALYAPDAARLRELTGLGFSGWSV